MYERARFGAERWGISYERKKLVELVELVELVDG